jgi:murein DD-endopeptidase MepM/ murein hydrolase activator NlpD
MIYRSVFRTNPTGYGNNTTTNFEMLSTMDDSDIVNATANTINELSSRIWRDKTKIERSLSKINSEPEKFKNIPAIQPLENKDLVHTSASVGMKMHPFYRIAKMHNGIDYTVPVGTKIIAPADGIVSRIVSNDTETGMAIYIDHGNGYQTVYAHLSKVLVGKESRVKRGKIIALSGDTGMSLFPHLHYEVWRNGKLIDPINCFFAELNPMQLEKIIDIASNVGQSLD